MNLSGLITISILIGIIWIISIVLTIVNLVKIASTSSLLNKLQKEIDKQYELLNTKKKEKAKPEKDEDLTDHQTISHIKKETSTLDKQGQIEIVQNVRKAYQNFKQDFDKQKTIINKSEPHEVSGTVNNETDQNEKREIILQNNEDVLDVVPADEVEPEEYEKKTITLYSQSGKYTDFKKLWNELIPVLKSKKPPFIKIDFNNISVISNKEMEYLQKVYMIIEKKNGILKFLNCNQELKNIFSKDNLLIKLIEEKQC